MSDLSTTPETTPEATPLVESEENPTEPPLAPFGDFLADESANRLAQTYFNNFVDVSGNVVVRHGSIFAANISTLETNSENMNADIQELITKYEGLLVDVSNNAAAISGVHNTLSTNGPIIQF
jgi:hypothetical protein